MQRVRKDLVAELLNGAVDKFGNSRDNEKRAALHVIERLLAFPAILNRQYEDLHDKKLKQEDRAQRTTGIHGEDVLNVTGESRYTGFTASR